MLLRMGKSYAILVDSNKVLVGGGGEGGGGGREDNNNNSNMNQVELRLK